MFWDEKQCQQFVDIHIASSKDCEWTKHSWLLRLWVTWYSQYYHNESMHSKINNNIIQQQFWRLKTSPKTMPRTKQENLEMISHFQSLNLFHCFLLTAKMGTHLPAWCMPCHTAFAWCWCSGNNCHFFLLIMFVFILWTIRSLMSMLMASLLLFWIVHWLHSVLGQLFQLSHFDWFWKDSIGILVTNHCDTIIFSAWFD